MNLKFYNDHQNKSVDHKLFTKRDYHKLKLYHTLTLFCSTLC